MHFSSRSSFDNNIAHNNVNKVDLYIDLLAPVCARVLCVAREHAFADEIRKENSGIETGKSW